MQPELVAIIISGFFSAATVRRAFLAGALDCFDKPFAWPQVLQRLEHTPHLERGCDEIPAFERVKWEYFTQLIAAFGGNVTHAARHARLHRTALQRIKRRRPDGAQGV